MKPVILITRPNHDIPTGYLHAISGELKDKIEDTGDFSIIELEVSKVTRINSEKALEKSNPRLIVLNGHGSYNKVYGQHEVILDENNIQKLQSKIVYAVVCDSSLELGEFAVENGKAEAYIGYEAYFMIIIEPSRSTTPLKDNNFKPFREIYVMLVLSLLSGFNVAESVEKTKMHIKSLIKDYGVLGIRDKFGDAPLIRLGLFWDLYFLKYHGNPYAKVFT